MRQVRALLLGGISVAVATAALPAIAGTTQLLSVSSAGQNDRVRCQACFQAVPVRSMALSVTTSLRMQAVSASLAGFPAWRSRS